MKIDKQVEHAVREAFGASVAEEPTRFNSALEAITDRGEGFTRDAINLAVAVDSAALFALHEGVGPDEDQTLQLARDFVRSQPWARIGEDVAAPFFTALAGGQEALPDALEVGDIAQASLAVGGWLLSAFLAEDRAWTDFLDDLLEHLERMPVQE